MTGDLALRPVRYDSADAVALTEQVQQFYVGIYGGPDGTPFTAEEFAPPNGGFLVGYVDGRPVAMGGWRLAPYAAPAGADRAAEIKRMFVADEARGRGFGRALLRALEEDAAAAGADWMVLETGEPQVAAVALYRGCGYVDIAPYGFYADKPTVVSLGKRLRPQH
ncbi:MAG TPA: GNAT family N-acetyltransferase [Propionibacteriaceae bacterium]|nr:GNAT family N-acetyltransferase [Propionibacteriaceae bacterium]